MTKNFIFLLLIFCNQCLSATMQSKVDSKTQIGSNRYRVIKLSNNLQCLLISKKERNKGLSYAKLVIEVGSVDDPPNKQGLAHLVQHTLFLEDTMQQNKFRQATRKYMVFSNQQTYEDKTIFQFQAPNNIFQQLLNLWSASFANPVFSSKPIQRQLQILQSERSAFRYNDTQRKIYVVKQLMKEDHPYRKYHRGSKKLLEGQILSFICQQFYRSTYSANLMKLIVASDKSIEQLQNMVRTEFSKIEDKKYKKHRVLESPFKLQSFQKIIKITPVKDLKVLQLFWILRDQGRFDRNKASQYLLYILNYEGRGSLNSLLVEEGLIFLLISSAINHQNYFSSFSIKVSLTEKGQKDITTIINYIQYYIQLIKQNPLKKWVLEQIDTINNIRLRYAEKVAEEEIIKLFLKKNNQLSVLKQFGSFYNKQWNSTAIQSYCQGIKRQNLIVLFTSKSVEEDCNMTEKHYGTKYGIQKFPKLSIDPNVMFKLQQIFFFPKKNPHLPTQFNLLEKGSQQFPVLAFKNEYSEIFYKKNHRFDVPAATVMLKISFNGKYSVKDMIVRMIYQSMIEKHLTELIQQGRRAEIKTWFSFTQYFEFQIYVSGFSSSVPKYFSDLFQGLIKFQSTQNRSIEQFNKLKQIKRRSFRNFRLNNHLLIISHFKFRALTLRDQNTLSGPQFQKQLLQIEMQDINEFAQSWKKSIYLQALVSGNIGQQTMKNICQNIQSNVINFQPVKNTGFVNVTKLKSEYTYIIQSQIQNSEEKGSGIMIYFQIGKQNEEVYALQNLLVAFANDLAVEYFRNQLKLGHHVYMFGDNIHGVLGVSLLILSEVFTTYELNQYIENFFSKILLQRLSQLTEIQFNQIKKSSLEALLKEDDDIEEESKRFWYEIKTNSYIFDRRQLFAKKLNLTKITQFQQLVTKFMFKQPHKLQIHLMSQHNLQKNLLAKTVRLQKQKNLKIYSDFEQFQKQMQFYIDLNARQQSSKK